MITNFNKFFFFLVLLSSTLANSISLNDWIKQNGNPTVTNVGGGVVLLNLANQNLDDIDDISNMKVYYAGQGILHLKDFPFLILHLNNNNLTSIPSDIDQLTGLTILNLNNNKLTSLPAELGHCSKLVELNIKKNNITLLPMVIDKLKNNHDFFRFNSN